MTNEIIENIEWQCSEEEAFQRFIDLIHAKKISRTEFEYKNEIWLVDFHPFDHSDDIIISEQVVQKYSKFLLVKSGGNRIRIPGFTTQEKLLSTPKRDIYRNGKFFHMVVDQNLSSLAEFKIPKELRYKTEFVINQQTADNAGHFEMISGILAGLHKFCKDAQIFFKDINQKDECIIGDKKYKIYTRDAFSDEDMLVYDSYYQSHPEIDGYILCKIKGGDYDYMGFVFKDLVASTRIVQMIGANSDDASKDIRRIFAEQYKNLSEILKIIQQENEILEIIEPQSFVPLHVHSEFSVGDAFGTISYLAETLHKKGFKGCSLTDHGTMAGLWEFQKKLLEKNIKPIHGCEIYISYPDDLENKRYHLTVMVKNQQGWKNLLKIQSMAVRENFYYKPVVKFEWLEEYWEGLIILSGCASSYIHRLIGAGNIEKAELWLNKMKTIWSNDFYAEMQIHQAQGTNNQETLQVLHKIAEKNSIVSVMALDSHYPKKEDKTYHESIKAINMKKEYGTAGYGDDCFFLLTEKDFEERIKEDHWMFGHYKNFLSVTNEIFDKVDFKIEPGKETDTLPQLTFPNQTRAEKLRDMCIEGLSKNTEYKYEGAIKERLDLEIGRFTLKGYENYFLVVADLIEWAKKNGIRCGPGRGSVGASLAAFALGITDCDPIEYDLLFDRFVSEIRRDSPDIDMDFMDTRREEVYDYLKNKYGKNNCAKVVTYSRFHPKGILKDVGRIFKIPFLEVEKICGMVIERSGGDARASFSLSDTFAEFAEPKEFARKYPQAADTAIKLEGHIRHRGMHAAAMIVTADDIGTYVPLAKLKDEIIVEWEKQLCEDMNLVKFDILGLSTLTVIEDCLQTAKCKLPKKFNDQDVIKKIFWEEKTVGVFQFNTVGMTKYTSSLQPDNFADLYDATTLYRPGALHSGQSMMYMNRKHGKEPVEYMHSVLEPITKSTRGIILYQEQIMQIMNGLGGMSWATAEMARKVITKSKGKDALNKMRNEFVTNAFKLHGMPIIEAERLYDVVSTFGSYSYNKAHAVEYTMISYYTAWLKLYYPEHFYKALLKYEPDENVIHEALLEMKERGITIEYPNINTSAFSYDFVKDKIYAGLNTINGIGTKMAEKIISSRPYANFADFKKRCKVSSKVLQGLLVADAFRDFGINKKALFEGDASISEDWTPVEWAQLIYGHTSLKPKIEVLQAYDFGKYPFIDIGSMNEKVGGKQILIRGIVTEKINKDKLLRQDLVGHMFTFERHMIYLNLNDGTGNIAVQINPATYEKYSYLLNDIEKKPAIIIGIPTKDGKKIYADIIQVMGQNKDVDDLWLNTRNLPNGVGVITSAVPAVSKNKKSYYRVRLSNGIEGMCFRFSEKMYPGDKVAFEFDKPFLNLTKVK